MTEKKILKGIGNVSEVISDVLFLTIAAIIGFSLYAFNNGTYNGNIFTGIEMGYLFPMLAATRLSALVLSDVDEKRTFADSCVDISAMFYVGSTIADFFGFYLLGIGMMFVMLEVMLVAAVAKLLDITYKKIKRSV